MHYHQWATEDFDLLDFIGEDGQSDSFSGGASTNGDQYSAQNQFSEINSEKDHMYAVLQYNDMMAMGHDNQQQMYGHGHPLNEMPTNGFLQDNRYVNPSSGSGLLNNTIEKIHNSIQQQQPSTSRLSNVVNNTPQQSYPNRMRPNMINSMAQPAQINGSDLAENVFLPTSSTSPQNNMYLTQPIVKCEPASNYDMYNSTSDNESHYSTNGLALSQTGSTGKPRKYRIKPESERVNPQYRAKRAKNNDAVRRSREKAKSQQHEKEKRLQFLENEHNEHYKVINQLNQQIRDLKAENLNLRKNCNCGGIQQVFRRWSDDMWHDLPPTFSPQLPQKTFVFRFNGPPAANLPFN